MDSKPRWKGVRYKGEGGGQAANGVFNIKVEPINYLNPKYELEILDDNPTTEQGLLLIGKLIPKQRSLPQFLLRWDEKGNHLNVDIVPQEEDWVRETNGYKGHRPDKVDGYKCRAFSLIIKIPTLNVIDAIISFNLARGVSTKSSITVSATVSHMINKLRGVFVQLLWHTIAPVNRWGYIIRSPKLNKCKDCPEKHPGSSIYGTHWLTSFENP